MASLSSLSRLSFFRVDDYHHKNGYTCNFLYSPRPHYCMGYVKKGRGIFCFDGREIEVREGEIIFVPLASRYRSVWYGEPDINYISYHFSFDPSGPFARTAQISIQKIIPDDSEKCTEIFSRAYLGQYGSETEQLSVLGEFFGLMSEVIRKLAYTEGKEIDSRIERAAEYIDYNYTRPISVSELARLANMSESYFFARFREELGVTPVTYKNRVCIRHAILLLISRENRSIEEISDALGYESSAYFRRIFKQQTGLSPLRYRKENMNIE